MLETLKGGRGGRGARRGGPATRGPAAGRVTGKSPRDTGRMVQTGIKKIKII